MRSTGLVVAMFSGLVPSGPFMRKGLVDIRLLFYCAIPIIIGAAVVLFKKKEVLFGMLAIIAAIITSVAVVG